MERWRAARAGRLKLPLAGTPDTERLMSRLFEAGIPLGAPVVIRIFKAESTLEVWMKKNGAFVPFAIYPVCYFSGGLGPKLREGDRQAPEGFYAIDEELLHFGGRWQRSLNLGFPNAFDRANGRSGSAILVHGGCDSSGCFAMTNAVNAELYDLVSAALRHVGHVPVHVFPFHMTDEAMAALSPGASTDFWRDLKRGYDSFERTHVPPHVSVCGRRYRVRDAMRGGADAGAIVTCAQDYDLVPSHLVTDKARPANGDEARALTRARDAAAAPSRVPRCSLKHASCRRLAALRDRAASRRHVAHAGRLPQLP